MISKRVTRLEDRLGVRLLQRTTRRVTPTDVGQSFYERVLAVLAAVEDAENFASVDSDKPRGLLKVSLPTSFGRLHVAPRLKSFLDLYPELRLLVDLNDDYVDLVAGSFDVAVRIGEQRVLLTGGCFQNRYLTERAVANPVVQPVTHRTFEGQ